MYVNKLYIFLGIGADALKERPTELQLAKLTLQMSVDLLRRMIIQLGLTLNEFKVTEADYQGNILNVMFLSLRKWRQKIPSGKFADISRAIKAEGADVHLLCKVIIVESFSFLQYVIEGCNFS